ncbi:hypothetical protein PVAND_000113 [Polypedilum vanderplanki]|uniref:Uncharacterized protein n=1 Tax=Polypedilum vanderplanki TaxID=319348 RepID=A0A9J6BJ17_POLVA|nr:hypothetical protein PVAND_000113 [Polypedilum vanderplanki]
MKLFLIFIISLTIVSSSRSFEWKEFNENLPKLPINSVHGGHDNSGKKLYIIRKNLNGKILYGDVGDGNDKKDGFVIDIDEDGETSVADFEILTAENYVWCAASSNNLNQEFPICRSPRGNDLLTGTLLSNGNCRLVHPEKTIKTNDVEVLIVGKTNCN